MPKTKKLFCDALVQLAEIQLRTYAHLEREDYDAAADSNEELRGALQYYADLLELTLD